MDTEQSNFRKIQWNYNSPMKTCFKYFGNAYNFKFKI